MSSNPRKANFVRPIDTDRVSPLEALRMATGEANAHRATELPLDQIKVDQSVQVRVDGLHEDTVVAYTAVLENGGDLDAVTVIRNEYGDYELADGFHRYEAHVRAGKMTILAYVHDGGHEAALDEAEEGNLRHGRPLTNEDKKNILRRRMKRGHAWATMSTRELGRLLGVGNKTISRWIEDFATVSNDTVDRSQITGADGRTINTGKIGKSPAPAPANPFKWENSPELVSPSQPAYFQWVWDLYIELEAGQSIQLPMGWRVISIDWGEGPPRPIIKNGSGYDVYKPLRQPPSFSSSLVEDHHPDPDLPAHTTMQKLDKGGDAPIMPGGYARKYAIESSLTTMWQSMGKFQESYSTKEMGELTSEDRLETMGMLTKTIDRAIQLWSQLAEMEGVNAADQFEKLVEEYGVMANLVDWAEGIVNGQTSMGDEEEVS